MTEPTFTGRGFARWEPIETSMRTLVRMYESSSAEGPHIWLALTQPTPLIGSPPELEASETHAHMTLAQAKKVHKQLGEIIEFMSARFDPVKPIGEEDRVSHKDDPFKHGTVVAEEWTEDGQKCKYVVEWDNGKRGSYWRDQLFLLVGYDK